MDFDALVCSSDHNSKQKWYGSGIRPLGFSEDDDLRNLKVSRIDDDNFSVSKTMQQQKSNSLMRSDGQQMLSFGSSDNAQSLSFPCYFPHSYGRNTGTSGLLSNNTTNMHGLLTSVRGPFTPSQWMELEHQALIYKYITANAPIPSNLIIPIRKALESACLSGGYLRQNALGWGGYPLGFSTNTDPEPGRCRRTDGKKWRCSRDAVPDQKYCERHMNRGRHRSRKPVEGQNGHSVSGPTNAKNIQVTSSSPVVARVAAGGGTSSGIGLSYDNHHQLGNLQPGSVIPSATPILNRDYLNKANSTEKIQETENLSVENTFSLPKHQNPYEEFGLVCSDSLLNPLHKSSITDPDTKSQNSLRQFMDDFPKNQTKQNHSFWPDTQSDRTQLSISIPTDLRLSRELDQTQMGLGMGLGQTGLAEPNHREAQWVPISWENSLGGPLGEVLHSNTSGLNLMTEGWDNISPPIRSSPTGVLQKVTFRSLSNSSAGSSPRTDHSICNNIIGSGLINSTLPKNLI